MKQSTNDGARPPGTKRLLLFGALFVGLSAAGAGVIYDRLAGRELSFDSRLLSAPVLGGCALLLLVYFAADGLRLHYTLKALGHRLSLVRIFRLVYINIFFSNITPMATGGGFAQIWYLRRGGVPLGTAAAATTVRTVLAVLFIFSAAPILLVTLEALDGRRLGEGWGLYLALFVAAYLGFFAVVVFRNRWLLAPLVDVLDRLRRWRLIGDRRHRRWRFGARREMLRLSRGLAGYLAGPRRDIALSIIFTFVFLLSLFSFPALLMWALDYEVDYLTVVGLLTVTTFIMYFSPTPGASGIAEGVFGYFFAGLVSAGHLVLITVAWRFLTIYLGMAVGLVVLQRELLRDQ